MDTSGLQTRSAHLYLYSQLSRKRPPLVHDKVVAYGRWSSMGKIKKKTQTELINVRYYRKLTRIVKIRVNLSRVNFVER